MRCLLSILAFAAFILQPSSFSRAQTEAVLKNKSGGSPANALTDNIAIKSGKSITVLSGGAITINSGASITNNGTATGFGGGAISTLTDVTLTNLAGLDLLMYDSGTSKWINLAPVTARIYLGLDGTIEGGLAFTGTNGASLNIGNGGALKSGAFTEYGTDENQLLRWASNSNSDPVTHALGATDLGAVKRVAALPIAAGGTNAETANAALNNLLPDQAAASSKVLRSDGANTSWSLVDLGSGVEGLLGWSSVDKTGSSIADLATRSASDINSGTLSTSRLSTTVGGAGTSDSGKVVVFGSDGSINVSSASGAGLISTVTTSATAAVAATLSGSTTAKGFYAQQLSSGETAFYATGSAGTGITLHNGTSNTFVVGMDGNITTGTFSGTLGAISGASLTNLDAGNIASGTLVVARGGTGLASGTSGGIPYFSGSATISSSAALTSGAIVVGGGAGSAPTASALTVSSSTLSTISGNLLLSSAGGNILFNSGVNLQYFGTQHNYRTSGITINYGSNTVVGWADAPDAAVATIDLKLMREAAATLQLGADMNGDATDQVVKAADGITGTDKSGGDLTLKSGDSTGSGTSAIIFSTPITGGGTGTTARTAAERVRVSGAGLTVGSGTAIAKIKHGTATLSSGVATVSDSDVVAGSRIFVNRQSDGGTIGDSFSIVITAATNFTIESKTANATAFSDTSTVYWIMFNP